MRFNINHLKDAGIATKTKMTYTKHFMLSFKEFLFCFMIAVFSLLHAVFPWTFDFKLIEWRVNRLKKLKNQFPDNPALKKVKFED